MSYKLIDANALNGIISNDDYEKVLNAPCIFADLPNGLDGEHYNLQEPKTGHWIYTPQQRLVDETDDGCIYETDYKCSCSECGGDFGFIKNKDAFCKFCGADMREVEE